MKENNLDTIAGILDQFEQRCHAAKDHWLEKDPDLEQVYYTLIDAKVYLDLALGMIKKEL